MAAFFPAIHYWTTAVWFLSCCISKWLHWQYLFSSCSLIWAPGLPHKNVWGWTTTTTTLGTTGRGKSGQRCSTRKAGAVLLLLSKQAWPLPVAMYSPDTRMHAVTWEMARRSLLLSIVREAFPVGLHWQAHMEGALFICSSLAAEGCSQRAGGPRLYSCGGRSLGGEGAVGLHGGGSDGARAGAFQWQQKGAGDRLIKVFADGLCYGTYVCA